MGAGCDQVAPGRASPDGSLPSPLPKGERTGLVLCRCGTHVGQVVRIGELARPAAWPQAHVVDEVPVLCSREGQAWLAARIREAGLDRVVIGGCSPREHERTFRAVLEGAGADPWRLQMVNLREQVEWGGGEPGAGTARARRMVAAALARVALHEPRPRGAVEVSGDAVVVGAGPAGLAAALALARRGRKVWMVERGDAVGGHANLLDRVSAGGECASCFLHPAIDEALHHPGVEILTRAEVADVRGRHGDFTVRVRLRPRRVDPAACLACGRCAEACPAELPGRDGIGTRRAIGLAHDACRPFAAAVDDACLRVRGGACDACASACPNGAVRLDERPSERLLRCGAVVVATGAAPPPPPATPGVLSAWQLERMLHPGGPTGGRLRRADGSVPRSVLLAPAPEAGDAVWPEALAKLGAAIRERLPGTAVTVAGGLGGSPRFARLAHALEAAGAALASGALAPGGCHPEGAGLRVRLEGGPELAVDLAGVWESPRPAPGAQGLARALRLATRADGFLEDRGSPLEPTATRVAGILVAGGAGGPRSVAEAIRDGMAAAGQVLSALEPGSPLPLEPLAARVDVERCVACALCASTCPSGAVGPGPDGERSRVEPSFCHGCGSCAAACPAGAIAAPHFTREQIAAEISGLLREHDTPGARDVTS